jgi:hypothetical protein
MRPTCPTNLILYPVVPAIRGEKYRLLNISSVIFSSSFCYSVADTQHSFTVCSRILCLPSPLQLRTQFSDWQRIVIVSLKLCDWMQPSGDTSTLHKLPNACETLVPPYDTRHDTKHGSWKCHIYKQRSVKTPAGTLVNFRVQKDQNLLKFYFFFFL